MRGQGLLEYLKGIQEQQLEARQHEHSPLVDVQHWSDVPRGTPLFESILVFENYPVDATVSRGSSVKVRDVQMAEQTNLPLSVGVMVVFFLIFETWFKVPLPKGPLENLLGVG